MQQFRNNPDGEANQAATRDNRRDVFAAKVTNRVAVFQGRIYNPVVPPRADDFDILSNDRLMLYHSRTGNQPTLKIAKAGFLTAGWVVGIFADAPKEQPADDDADLIGEAEAREIYGDAQ